MVSRAREVFEEFAKQGFIDAEKRTIDVRGCVVGERHRNDVREVLVRWNPVGWWVLSTARSD